ncbi:uncharacterized protein ACA1_058250 [Acanthamoeba castellanii str. Neff]|uniref:Uncharacterized protein n=1 Tax=Acanthamoeba castellanii (strain ATCC 30010 / Neff) TaxID=1257118 RepID=L8GVD9_ACACF|nr:uncharacterized protein ACA1_058250 [Acanthamoeba castellanii str. Neff]ELR17169.1 hypothetical protein ACA1_058250 [Acanthamoeba castellanii str. Neff]
MFNRGDGERLYKEKLAAFPEIQIKRDSRLGLLRWELDKPGQFVLVGDQRQHEGEEDMARAVMTHLKALEGRTNVALLSLSGLAHHDATKPVWTQIVGNHLSTTFAPSPEDLALGLRDAVLEVGQCGPPPLIVIDGAHAAVVLQEFNGAAGTAPALVTELVQLHKAGHLSIVLFSA